MIVSTVAVGEPVHFVLASRGFLLWGILPGGFFFVVRGELYILDNLPGGIRCSVRISGELPLALDSRLSGASRHILRTEVYNYSNL